jgi:hypothetical protein
MDELGYMHYLIKPGVYHIHLGCRLDESWQISLGEEGFSTQWFTTGSQSNGQPPSKPTPTSFCLYAQDQGDVLALLTYLYGLGIPLLAVEYAEAAPARSIPLDFSSVS